MVDDVSCAQGFAQAWVIIHYPCFNCLSVGGGGGLESCIGLPALQPVPCSSRSYVGEEGHGRLVYKCIMPVPLSCCSLVAFKLLTFSAPTLFSAKYKSFFFIENL